MYHNGDIVEGIITGIQPYGVFVKIDDKYDGLIHISELSDKYIRDIHEYATVKEKVRVKILDVGFDHHHFKLSLKALDKRDLGRKRYNVKKLMPRNVIGFKTLEMNLENWIQEGMKGE